MGKLIDRDDLGNWGVKGLPWKQLHVGCVISKEVHNKLYGCLWKLMEYESTGLTPQQVEEQKEKQIPMEVKEIHVDEYYCLACGSENNCDQKVITHKYCPECGQALIGKEQG